jgi:hypothetical protein
MDDFDTMPKMAGWHDAKLPAKTPPSMVPTNKLRFVERVMPAREHGENIGKTVRILQQWWAPFRTFSDGYGYQTVELKGGEWRDVQLEKEEA